MTVKEQSGESERGLYVPSRAVVVEREEVRSPPVLDGVDHGRVASVGQTAGEGTGLALELKRCLTFRAREINGPGVWRRRLQLR